MGNSPRDCGPGGQWLGFIFYPCVGILSSCRELHVLEPFNIIDAALE